ncbi:carbohydrate-binding-like protein, partial [Globomyces pollinis-pini]
FVVINSAPGSSNNKDFSKTINTGLPAGSYCNMVYAKVVNNKCQLYPGLVLSNKEQVTYVVDSQGRTTINIRDADNSRVVALYSAVDGRFDNTDPVTTTTGSPPGPTGTVTVVNFVIDGISTQPGQSVKVLGSTTELGSWSVPNAVNLSVTSCAGSVCRWSGSVTMNAGASAEWKAILVGNGVTRWQCGANQKLTVGQSATNVEIRASIC